MLKNSYPKNLAIFASGEGTNFSALVHYFKKTNLPLKVKLLICDHQKANVLNRSKKELIPTFVINFKKYSNKIISEKIILKKLKKEKINFIILAGYMRIIGPTILSKYEGKIINIHPALLPHFPGKTGIKDAFNAKAKNTGVTVHWVDKGIDTGEIIAQRKVPIYKNDNLEKLTQRIHHTEHKLYPETVQYLFQKGEI